EENATQVVPASFVVALGDCEERRNPMPSPIPLSPLPMSGRRIAVVAARWHAELVDRTVGAFVESMTSAGACVDVVEVPGAFEIPLRAKRLALSGEYDAIACCALVV